jgi:hypothetical protein
MTPAAREVRFEELVGKPVDGPGGPFAQIEDLRIEPDGDEYVVLGFILGPLGLRAKIHALLWSLPTLRALGLGKKHHTRVLPWDMMDLSDPTHPKLRE